MSGHLLVLKGLTWGLPLAGRAMAAVRDRDAVGGSQPAEIMPLHRPGKTLADADADHIDILAREKMRRGDFRAHLQECVLRDAEFGEMRLRLDLRLGEMAPLRLRYVLGLGATDAELHRRVAVCILGSYRDDLAIVDLEHRHRDMVSLFGEYPSHTELLSEQTGAHRAILRV